MQLTNELVNGCDVVCRQALQEKSMRRLPMRPLRKHFVSCHSTYIMDTASPHAPEHP